MQQARPLQGRRILVLEDAIPVLLFMKAALEDAGAVVLTATDQASAVRILDGTGIAAAVLDVRLELGTTHMLAHLLKMRRIPFLFQTGFPDDAAIAHPEATILPKPFTADQLVAAVQRLSPA